MEDVLFWIPGGCRCLGEGRGREAVCRDPAAPAPARVSVCPVPYPWLCVSSHNKGQGLLVNYLLGLTCTGR